ncbi:MAG: DegV family protein [Anaerotignum sp.]|nr:DegV family protein [Anaerotignum sp.]MBQ7102929.1 DegV family protein [Anaerotignum sp.]
MSYILSCCSTADLSKEHFEKRNINYVCFHYYLDEAYYPDDLGQTMSFPEFYKAMENGAMTKTSQVNVTEFEEYFEPFLKEGKDILHVTLSSGISGVYNSAMIAKSMMEEKYPDRKIYVVDSLSAACGYGMLMDTLADMRDAGKSIDEVHDWVEENKGSVHHWVTATDLTYLIRGGRLSKTSGFVGQMLSICPVLTVVADGSLKAMQKVRTKKKVMEALANKVVENTEDGAEYAGKCYIGHSACEEDAKALVAMVEGKVPALKDKIVLGDIGTVIGSHTGPGAMVVCFYGKERA